MTREELKVSDIYSSYLDYINILQKENKELVTKCKELEKKLEIACEILKQKYNWNTDTICPKMFLE